jgi:catechol 2,3-dioxygenase-like lactoylglutathione lyase family enzyme
MGNPFSEAPVRRNATLFVLISLLGGFGSTAMSLAASLWVLDLTGSVSLAALGGMCTFLPTFAAPWLGALVDRLPRRTLVIAIDVALSVILFSLLTVHSAAGVPLIYGTLLARGLGYVLGDAGETALLAAALPPSMLGDVNGWRSSAQEGMKLVAPLAGAALYAWRGPAPVVVISAVLPLVTAACYALLRLTPPVRADAAIAAPIRAAAPTRPAAADADGADPVGGVRAGVRALFGRPAVREPVLIAGVAIAMSGLTNAAVLSRVVHGLHLPATHLGILSSAQGAGSIVSGLVAGRLLAHLGSDSRTRLAALGAAIFAGGCVAWSLPSWPSMIAGSVLSGLGLPWTLIAGTTAVQTEIPDRLLGRVAATSTSVMFGGVALTIPLGAALAGAGGRPLLAAAAVLSVAAPILITRKRTGRADRTPTHLRWAVVGFDIDGIHHIALRVADLERSRSFYAGVLGLVADQDFPGEKLRFRLGGNTRLVLRPPLPGTTADERLRERRVGLDHVSLGVPGRVELERLVSVLRAAGVATQGIMPDPTGPGVVNFRDPDGIAWEFFEQPASSPR